MEQLSKVPRVLTENRDLLIILSGMIDEVVSLKELQRCVIDIEQQKIRLYLGSLFDKRLTNQQKAELVV